MHFIVNIGACNSFSERSVARRSVSSSWDMFCEWREVFVSETVLRRFWYFSVAAVVVMSPELEVLLSLVLSLFIGRVRELRLFRPFFHRSTANSHYGLYLHYLHSYK